MPSDRFQASSATLLPIEAGPAQVRPALTPAVRKNPADNAHIGSARRILHCWLPRLSTDRVVRRQPALAQQPFAVVRHDRGRRIAVAVNALAASVNVRAGQSLADARSLCPSLLAVEADPAADSRLLYHLARWCTRYTPWVTPDIPQRGSADDHPFALFEGALVLDISGCAHLAGGEDALLADIAARFRAFGFATRTAIADTPGAAWAWARHGDAARPVIPAKQQKSWLSPLPATALRLRDSDAETLLRLGIATVGDLIALPRAAVANRFQNSQITSVLYRLDQALGSVPESVSPLPAPADYSVRQHYAEPIGTPEGVAAAFERLLLALGGKLEAAGMGARQLEFTLIRADDTLDSARIGVSRPTRDPAHLARLFAPRLESLDPDPGVETVILTAISAEKFSLEQHEIQKVKQQNKSKLSDKFSPTAPALNRHAHDGGQVGGQVGELIDRLSNRLGRDAILRALPCETALPEAQTVYVPALDTPALDTPALNTPTRDPSALKPHAGDAGRDWHSWQSSDRLTGPALPVRLLEAPEPLERVFSRNRNGSVILSSDPPAHITWRRQSTVLTAPEGPARRLGRWWQGETAIRDYWQVEAALGGSPAPLRLWLYHDPADGWAVQGLMG